MFDFLKDNKHTQNKYKSTMVVPSLISEDLTENNNEGAVSYKDTLMEDSKEEYTPFFPIQEDMEMEDQMSISDDMNSEPTPDSIESEKYDSAKGKP